DAFESLLEGAAAMDRHFRLTPPERNAPVLAAFVDLYYAVARGAQTRGVFAYDERLRLLPFYLQQLEMESNGKRVKTDGSPVGAPPRRSPGAAWAPMPSMRCSSYCIRARISFLSSSSQPSRRGT